MSESSPLPAADDTSFSLLTQTDFSALFGIKSGELPAACRELIDNLDFRYRRPDTAGRDRILLEVIRRLDSGNMSVSGEKRRPEWEKGWAENLQTFVQHDFDLGQLTPKYVRPDQPVRLHQEYVLPVCAEFELNFYTVFRNWLFRQYLHDAGTVFEFGCGTGYNLAMLARLFPQKQLYGLDWSVSSRDLVNKIAEATGYAITGLLFDMFSPDDTLVFPSGSAVLTLNSLEQLGTDHEQLIQFFLRKAPALCIHAEPFYELYDEKILPDYLAMQYHAKRNYLRGYLPRLRQLEEEGRIEILRIHRVPFGSLFHEGYSLCVWRPVKK
ncbi:MAG: hypothetical protein C0402_09840 [Thermodesulfovibrio sp.]|nr:hypothetical protein [Thermodesulfovibrio sp.]